MPTTFVADFARALLTALHDAVHVHRAHGISANKRMGLAPYAEIFASLGYAAIVFDYRRWGLSGTYGYKNCLIR